MKITRTTNQQDNPKKKTEGNSKITQKPLQTTRTVIERKGQR